MDLYTTVKMDESNFTDTFNCADYGSNVTGYGVNYTQCVTDENPGPVNQGLDFSYIMSHPIYININIITKYRYYVLIPLAILGNTLCFLIFYPHMRVSSGYFFMGQVALWDMITIIVKGVKYFLDLNKVTLGNFGCKMTSFLVAFCPAVAVWLIIIMTFDRLFVVTSPFKYKRHCSIKMSYVAYAVLITFMALFELQEFITMGVSMDEPALLNRCVILPKYRYFYRHVWTTVYYSVFTVIPVVLLTGLNTLPILRIRRKLDRMSERRTHTSSEAKRHVTRMAVAVSVVFVVCNVPQCVVFLMLSAGYQYRRNNEAFLQYIIGKHVAFTLQMLNHCVNIFLYFVSGRKFRRDVIFLFRFRRLPSVTLTGKHQAMTKQASNTSVTRSSNLTVVAKTTIPLKDINGHNLPVNITSNIAL